MHRCTAVRARASVVEGSLRLEWSCGSSDLIIRKSVTGESWHLGPSSWADRWDPHCRYGYVFPMKGPSFWSGREGNRMRPSVLFVSVWVLSVSRVLIREPSHVYVYKCVYGQHAPSRYWPDLGTGGCGSLSLLHPAAPDAFITALTLFCISICSSHSPILKN